MEFYNQLLLLRTHDMMVCQATSATSLLREALKAGPLYLQRTLDPKKISATTLNSTHPGRGDFFDPVPRGGGDAQVLDVTS
jgi:hypothetical protein